MRTVEVGLLSSLRVGKLLALVLHIVIVTQLLTWSRICGGVEPILLVRGLLVNPPRIRGFCVVDPPTFDQERSHRIPAETPAPIERPPACKPGNWNNSSTVGKDGF